MNADQEVRAPALSDSEAKRREPVDVRIDAQAWPDTEIDHSRRNHGERLGQQFAQRIVVGIDLDMALSADRRLEMHRRDQPDAAAKPMRAEQPVMAARQRADVQAAAEATPLADI